MGKGVRLVPFLLVALVVGVPASGALPAEGESATYEFKMCTEPLGATEHPPPCIAEAPNGHRLELFGEGIFKTGDEHVTGSGTFVHTDADGKPVVAGTWDATKLVGFHGYGDGTRQGTPQAYEGGKAELRIVLNPAGGGVLPGIPQHEFATLIINSAIGNSIADPVEGVKVLVDGALGFDKPAGGAAAFVRLA